MRRGHVVRRPAEIAKVTRVHVLTEGFTTANGQAFLFPLVVHRMALREHGIELAILERRLPQLTDCDVLVVDSKFHRREWRHRSQAALEEFARWREAVPLLLYFDTSDSSACINPQVIPFVSRYYKGQLLKDRGSYRRPHYGLRVYTDYYHRHLGVDDEVADASIPLDDESIAKLAVSWSSALANYSLHGPMIASLFHRIRWKPLLRFPKQAAAPSASRPVPLHCRMGMGYAKESVAAQRKAIGRLLGDRAPLAKVSRRFYLRELARSKVVLSPFGLGEITLKDFEVFLAGAALLKADMTHLETWPDLYRDCETMMSHRWDLADLEEKIARLLGDDDERTRIAANGQARYVEHLTGANASTAFCERFRMIVEGKTALG